MQRSIYRHIIADTLAATAGGADSDLKVNQDELYVNGIKVARLLDVRKGGASAIPAVSSETLGVLTFTVASGTPNYQTQYGITLYQPNPNAQGADQNPIVYNYTITTPATGTLTPTTVALQLYNKINADTNKKFTVSSGATLVITGSAGYPVIVGNWNQNPDSSTVVQTTQGIAKVGSVAEMVALGATSDAFPPTNGVASNTIWASGTSGTFADTYYDAYYFESYENIGENNTSRINQGVQTVLWVGKNAANKATFEGILAAMLGGFLQNGTTTSYHQLETIQQFAAQ